MTRLLVSVRSAAEALLALAGGAEVIDVKEPSRGALGSADPSVWQEVVHAVAQQSPVSVALGELRDFDGAAARNLGPQLTGICWAKLGLAGCGSMADWQKAWRAAIATLPPHVQSVAVIYADWGGADAPPPEAVLEAAVCAGVSLVLIDTYDKNAGGLLDHLPLPALESLAQRARLLQLKLAVAGSLRRETISSLDRIAPDYVAVRGAVCRGHREAEVCEQLVRQLSSEVRRLRPAATVVATANA